MKIASALEICITSCSAKLHRSSCLRAVPMLCEFSGALALADFSFGTRVASHAYIVPSIFSLARGLCILNTTCISTLRKVRTILVPPIPPDVDPLAVWHAGIQSLGVFALEMQRNLTVKALAANDPKPNMRVALVRLYRVAATRPANEHIGDVVILGIAFHRCIFSSDRPLATARSRLSE